MGAKASPAYYLAVKVEEIDGDCIHGHGDALHKLRLPVDVIHPMSLRQMRLESVLERLSTPDVSVPPVV